MGQLTGQLPRTLILTFQESIKFHILKCPPLQNMLTSSTLMLHPNLLHRSEANLSDNPRWSVISAYNLSYNLPFREIHTSCITPVEVVPDEAILESGKKEVNNADFLKKEAEITLNVK